MTESSIASSSGFRTSRRSRRGVCRLVRLDYDAQVLPPDAPKGFDRVLHLFRRTLEMIANARRAGPWADAVVLTKECIPDLLPVIQR